MKRMVKLTALLLAFVMIFTVPASASGLMDGVSLDDYDAATYMQMLNAVKQYGIGAGVYEYLLGQLEDMDYSARYEQLSKWHGTMASLYASMVAYYESAYAGGSLICTCDAPQAHGGLHTDSSCPWHFAQLSLAEQYAVIKDLTADDVAAYLQAVSESVQSKLQRINLRTYTAEADQAEVSIAVPEGAFAENYLLTAESAEPTEAMLEALGENAAVAAFDISFRSIEDEGVKYQPAAGAPVALTFDVPTAALADTEGETYLQVYHMAAQEDGTYVAEPVTDPVAVDPDATVQTLSVAAEEFSFYIVADTTATTGTKITSSYEMKVGETIVIYTDFTNSNAKDYRWSYTSNSAFSIVENGSYVTVNALDAGSIVLRYQYQRQNNNWKDGESITITATEPQKIKFYPNYTSGDIGEPYEIIAEDDGSFVFPTLDAAGFTAPTGMKFNGWSQNSAPVSNFDNSYTPNLQGNAYEEGTVFYARWYNPDAQNGIVAYFFIRIDGQIPYEPDQEYKGSDYYPSGAARTDKNKGTLRNAVPISNDLKAVKDNIQKAPDNIQELLDAGGTSGVTFDPSTQEVIWYVIKHTGDSDSQWHVDGIIRDKAKYLVIYDPNGGDSNVPTAKQYIKDSEVSVEYYPIPNRTGYTFLGWDENKDAISPTYIQNGSNNSFEMPEQDVTLYAIWMPNNNTQYTVNHYLVGIDGLAPAEPYESETKYGTTGSNVTADAKSYTGYALNTSYDGTVSSGLIAADGSFVLKLYYTRQTGNLTINKQVKDATFTSDNRVFKFTVAPKEGATLPTASELQTWASQDTSRAYDETNDCVTVTVSVDTSKVGSTTLTGLPTGVYTVTETEHTGYVSDWTDDATDATVTAGTTASVTCVNTRSERKEITVRKVWEDDSDAASLRPDSILIVLTIDGKLSDIKELTATNHTDSDSNVWEDELEIELFDEDGNTVTYSVAEYMNVSDTGEITLASTPGIDYYDTAIDVDSLLYDDLIGKDVTVTVTNTINSTSLNISKTGLREGESAIFTVKGTILGHDGESTWTVVLTGPNASVTIDGLQIGTPCTVTEDTSWSWRYTTENPSRTINSLQPTGNEVKFENNRKGEQWLYDESIEHNVFETPASTTTEGGKQQ